MTDVTPAERIATELLACVPNQRQAWLEDHASMLTLAVVEALKQSSIEHLQNNYEAAIDSAECAALVAGFLPHEPRALPLAHWTKGNLYVQRDPRQALIWYGQALDGFRNANALVEIADVQIMRAAALTECGELHPALACYDEARTILARTDLAQDPAKQLRSLEALEQQYGWLLYNLGDYQQALEVNTRALDYASQMNQPEIIAEIHVNQALVLGMIGRLDDGIDELLKYREIAAEHNQHLTVARIDMNLGTLYIEQGRFADALEHLQKAKKGFETIPMEVASVLMREASLYERIGAENLAYTAYKQAYTQFTNLDMLAQVREAMVRGAAASRIYGKYAEAYALLDQAEQFWQGQPVWETLVLLERARLALDLDDSATALSLLQSPIPAQDNRDLVTRHALLLAEAQAHTAHLSPRVARESFNRVLYDEQQGNRHLERQALAGLGLFEVAHDPQAAEQLLRGAAQHDEEIRQSLSVQELKASFYKQTSNVLSTLTILSIEQRAFEQALSYAWQAKAGPLLDLCAATETERRLPPNEQAEIRGLRQKLAAHRWQLALEGTTTIPDTSREAQDPQVQELEAALRQLRLQFNRRAHIDTTKLHNPGALLESMDADLLIEYVSYTNQFYALLADRSGMFRAVKLPESVSDLNRVPLPNLFDTFKTVVKRPDRRLQNNDAWLAECLPNLRILYDLLIRPLGDLPKNARLLIAPCDTLHEVPFAALWDGHSYLVQQHQIEMMLSGGLLAAGLPAGPTMTPLVIADSAQGAFPDIRLQAHSVKTALALPDNRVLLDNPEALDYLADAASPPRILHMTAHTLLRTGDAELFSALQLVEHPLSVEEAYELPLMGTELVSLIGCSTGTNLWNGGLLGFQSAFLAAGAHRVLSTLWPIQAADTVPFVEKFYNLLRKNIPVATALQETQQYLLTIPERSHPAIWAAFTSSRR